MAGAYASFWPGFGTGGAAKRDLSNLAAHPDSAKHDLFVKGDGTFDTPEAGGLVWASVPASSTATGAAGDLAYDTDYLYVCVATDTWRRFPLSDWS